MTGAIPKYGEYFRRRRVDYTPGASHTLYVLKSNPDWYIRADSTSERWWVFNPAMPVAGPFATLTEAMPACRAEAVKLTAGPPWMPR